MIDMTETIQAKSDQMNAIDLIGGPQTIVISKVKKVNDPKQPIHISYEGGDAERPYKPCLGMRRAMVQMWGKDGSKYVGQTLVLWNNPIVIYAGKEAGGIEILKASGIDKPEKVKLVVTRGKNRTITIEPIIVKPKATLAEDDYIGYCADLDSAKSMSDLAKIGASIREQNYDKEGSDRLGKAYQEAVKVVRALIETPSGE